MHLLADAYHRAPGDVSEPPWSVGTDLGEQSTESAVFCCSKNKNIIISHFQHLGFYQS